METTKAHFEHFKRQCDIWVRRLGLMSWQVYYIHEKFEKESEEALADCSTHYSGRFATIKLNKDWGITEPTKKELDLTALHEVLEILMGPLMCLAQARVWDAEEYDKEHHSVIRTLENLLMK